MANKLQYASIFQSELDKQLVAEATSGWMEPNAAQLIYNGGAEVKVPSIVMEGLGDYDRNKGFVDGAITLTYQTMTMTQDRGRTFSLDAMDVDETNFVAAAGTIMGEFQREHIAPEIDAYRYSRIASLAMANDRASGGYTPSKASIFSTLLNDIATVQDVVGESVKLVISLSYKVANILSLNDEVKRRIDVVDFVQGGVTTKVQALDGIPIRRVPSARMKTEYLFRDGETEGQEAGGFAPTEKAKDINWLITARNAPIAVSKTDIVRVFDPETNQKANAWKIDFRKYHDLWIPTNKLQGVFANIQQEL
ncbi:MAG: hypothetical protein E6230_02640 [Paenibacillus dendritiformis]|uniref:hypothetical protein n=1 Tax=uncultured Paenibacillus sp. TaxID=227322 RepID=UPI0025DAA699|nr:hypothetical protein [uncultured Paenibacillus sp.]MDU5141071.1 hypothetical protein [Paenibacillus dendritiformis]